MKNWVNADFASGYYDIATIDGKLAELSDALAEGNTESQKSLMDLYRRFYNRVALFSFYNKCWGQAE